VQGVGAQQIEMSTNYAVGEFYYGKIIDFLNVRGDRVSLRA
jgi:hypothetical protein